MRVDRLISEFCGVARRGVADVERQAWVGGGGAARAMTMRGKGSQLDQ